MRIPLVTKALLWAMGIVFALQLLLGQQAMLPFMLWPLGDHVLGTDASGQLVEVGFRPWQLVTYALMHDTNNLGHLFFNALALVQFGPAVEQVLGARRYGLYLLVCVVGAGLTQLLFAALGFGGPGVHGTLGASGGIYGVLLAYAMMFPHQRLMLLMPPIPMKARTLVIGFGVISLVLGVTGAQAGVAHFAHLGGMLFGLVLLLIWRRSGWRPPPSVDA